MYREKPKPQKIIKDITGVVFWETHINGSQLIVNKEEEPMALRLVQGVIVSTLQLGHVFQVTTRNDRVLQ